MRLLLSIFLICTSYLAVGQNLERVNVIGKIVVEGSDLDGITIYNATSNKGTVTNKQGEFMIGVALNDLLQIRAVDYQNIDVNVNQGVLSSKKMSIYLIEEMIMLDEVVVSHKELSGSIAADAGRLPFTPKEDAFYFGVTKEEADLLIDDGESQIRNLHRTEQGQYTIHGLDMVNVVDQLLIPLFRSEVEDKEEAGVPEVPAENIKYYLGSDFIAENFSIPEHRIEEFIRYVEKDTFDFDLLNYGHELEFLELLNKKSKTFLEK